MNELSKAPTLFTNEPHFDVSEKYHFIPTIDVIEKLDFITGIQLM